ncbi:ligand-binding sensor domain-containing protein [Pantanalinema sp. GBBB05]|uniref:ligand-binding sensor domain-containing protein n=1 Tax=Pantanalinema sp. GBBB05 TaxID=2604139 RepID=UPI001DD38CEB|nr:transcriptional regulator [Pantanalinema sp. GBBB05]
MALRTSLIRGLISSIVVLGWQGWAYQTPVRAEGVEANLHDRQIAQTPIPSVRQEPAPVYPPTAPPPRQYPLPNQRQTEQEQTIGVDYRISALQPDSSRNLWVASWQGLAQIDPNTGQILKRISLPNITVGALAQDRSGRIWVGSYEGLVRVDPRNGQLTAQNFALPSNRILSLLVDKRGYLWVGTDAGLVLISPDRGLIMTTVKNLPGVSANALTLDTKGNLWVGTLDGMVRINTASGFIMQRITDLPGTTVQTLATNANGTIWAGTPNALLELDFGYGPEPPPPAPKPAAKPATTRKPPAQLRRSSTRATSRVATRPARKPTQTAKPKPQQRSASTAKPSLPLLESSPPPKLRSVTQLQGRNITALRFDKTNRLWVGTGNGLVRVNPANGAVEGEISNLPSAQIFSLAADTGNKLWVGTGQGLAWVSMSTYQIGVHNTFFPVKQ